ncbi:hypothetical protein GCM10009742_42410 [Kribbella karoonensis]|uniref:Uncharacterized protein n=1 Tax=Kribbella karoonensis TaxID=324851 RepID=A0ABN2DZ74_9ACTN
MPEISADDAPQRTNPAAKPANEGSAIQTAYPSPLINAPSISSLRREYESAQAPDGTSSTNPVADQITNSSEIWAGDSP